MYALCVSGAVNTQGFVWSLFFYQNVCTTYKFSFVQYFHLSPFSCCFGALKIGFTPKIQIFLSFRIKSAFFSTARVFG